MKKIISILFLLLPCVLSYAQFKLQGHIKQFSKGETPTVNIPLVFGYFREDNIDLPVDDQGNFEMVLPISEEKIAYFRFENQEMFLWMKPATDLSLVLDSGDVQFHGSMAQANQLLYKLGLHEMPSFCVGNERVSAVKLQDSIVRPFQMLMADKRKWIDASPLSTAEKDFLKAELHYYFVAYLNQYVRSASWPRSELLDFTLHSLGQETPQPKSAFKGPMYYAFVDAYCFYLEGYSFSFKEDPTKLANILEETYGIGSMDSLSAVFDKYGRAYMNWLAVRHAFDAETSGAYLAKHIKEKFNGADLSEGGQLLEVLRCTYAHSKFMDALELNMARLKEKMTHSNKNILIPDNYRTFESIKAFLQKYRGKVVYLDLWGTWCGYCRIEMDYVLALKDRFAGKDIEFAYLAMDEDKDDTKWREYIQINDIAGVHLRKNRSDIQQIWDELLPDNKERHGLYPSYFLFDKEGNLVNVDALRPSNVEALYQELEEVLDK